MSIPLPRIDRMIESDFTAREWLLPGADATTVLAIASESVAFSREAERLRVRVILQWCQLHPASPEDGATWGEVDGRGSEAPLTREGCPDVAYAVVAELAGTFAMSTAAMAHLVDACLEARFRLPRLFARFEALEVDWARLRQVTRLTESLNPAAAEYVDRVLAPIIDRVGPKRVEDTVAAAIALFDPERAAEKARVGKKGWHVTLQNPQVVDFDSTSWLDAQGDSLDLEDFMAGLARVATDLRVEGDPDTFEQRMAKALGVVGRALTGRPGHSSADEQEAPPADADDPADDDTSTPGLGPDPEQTSTPAPAGDPLERLPVPRSPQRRGCKALVVHAHLHTDAMTGSTRAVFQVPRLGAVGEDVFERWVAIYDVKVSRVIDLSKTWTVDQHDPPGSMRTLVRARDRHCVFPECEVPARACDLDHIVPYDENGPPGQTSPQALACLCRGHHLLKTFHGWRYGRLSDGSYLWVSPLRQTYLVDRTGTDGGLGAVA